MLYLENKELRPFLKIINGQHEEKADTTNQILKLPPDYGAR
jgi:hypothetical protein